MPADCRLTHYLLGMVASRCQQPTTKRERGNLGLTASARCRPDLELERLVCLGRRGALLPRLAALRRQRATFGGVRSLQWNRVKPSPDTYARVCDAYVRYYHFLFFRDNPAIFAFSEFTRIRHFGNFRVFRIHLISKKFANCVFRYSHK